MSDFRKHVLCIDDDRDTADLLAEELTILSDRADELKGRQLGADDYITKPVDFGILTTIITARLARVARSAVSPMVDLTEREAETLT
jgi:DNA-binding response OmpR family regulator